jgi:hypothetical protein
MPFLESYRLLVVHFQVVLFAACRIYSLLELCSGKRPGRLEDDYFERTTKSLLIYLAGLGPDGRGPSKALGWFVVAT